MDDSPEPCVGQPEPDPLMLIPPPPRETKTLDDLLPVEIVLDIDKDAGAASILSSDELALAVERLETSTAAGFAEVLREFRDKLALDRFKEDQITRLHEELQAYRNDLISRTARQILQGLIRLHDDLGRVSTSLRQRPVEELTPDLFFRQFEGFQDDVELLLGQHEVERFEVPGEDFEPRRQTVARTIPTEDAPQVGKIAERVRPGFQQGETILQKERVAVYVAVNGAKG